jgi:hypothetical protein
VLARGPEGTLHVVFEKARGEMMQVHYRAWRPGRGWDAVSTDLTDFDDTGTTRPQPLPIGPDLVVVYNQYGNDGARFMVHRRQIGPSLAVELPREPQVTPRVPSYRPNLRFGPSPLRAGSELQLEIEAGAGSAPPRVDVFDLAGRRLAEIALRRVDDRWAGRVAGEITRHWSSGVYFARVRDRQTTPARIVVLR